ncbi:hypothetical protein A9P82_03735 [Arachidicoccus ginsenosidimutans]|nr:hypothetical protein A9P82_03735 [Arachidicoccus sp. BS20]
MLFLTVLLLLSCKHKKAEYSFYYWKNTNNYSDYFTNKKEDSLIVKLGVQHFYIKFMDVDWSEHLKIPVPANSNNYESAIFTPLTVTQTYTPVIFITNRTFERIDSVWCNDSLAVKLKRKINETSSEIENAIAENKMYRYRDSVGYSPNFDYDAFRDSVRKTRPVPYNEIQIDCDWTASTRDKYFAFLRSLKKQFPDKIISVTIRLYPYKYPDKIGVPPVDKGMLMCYNLGAINNPETKNSIFDLHELKAYLNAKHYKLPLDIALPIFGWYVWFRDNQVKGLIYQSQLNENIIRHNFDSIVPHRFQMNKDFVIDNNYLREGDILREEFPDKEELITAATLLHNKFPNAQHITFFDWDYKRVKEYENTIQKIYTVF